MNYRFKILQSAALVALAMPVAAHAGAEPGAAAAPAAAGTDPAAIKTEEIIVTANKREQNINNVGVTISAFSAATLQNRRIETLADLAATVPGLTFAVSNTNTPILTLRGVGYNDNAVGVYSAVSVYVDEVPLPFPVMAVHSAYDLARVEVLKGPQGLLFGENSTGGAINYIAAKPTSAFAAGGDVSFGRFNALSGNAFVSGPITSTLGARIALTGENSDGWQQSYTRNDTLGRKRYIAGRILLDWEPLSSAKFELNINGWIDKSDPQAGQFIGYSPQAPAHAKPPFEGAAFAPLTPRAADWTAGLPYSDRKFGQAAVRGDIKVTDGIQLTTLVSYEYFKQGQAVDQDGTPYQGFDFPINDATAHSFNEEIRLSNKKSADVRWVVGENYEESKVDERQLGFFGDGSNSYPQDLFLDSVQPLTTQNLRNYAFFGNVEYDVIQGLTLKGGLRYSNTRDTALLCNLDGGDGHANELFTIISTLEQRAAGTGIVVTPILPGQCNALTPLGLPSRTPTVSELQQHNVSWRVGADYKLTSRFLVYANVSKGYKAGTFPTIAVANTAQYAPVTQESVVTYEAGFKAGVLGNLAHIDAAAFYYDYANKQVHGRVNIPPFGPIDALVNVPKSRIYGAELEVTVHPVAGLTLSGGVTYLDTKVLTYQGYDVLGAVENFQGDRLPTTPTWTYNLNVDEELPAIGGGHPFFGATVVGRSDEDAAFGGSSIVLPGAPAASAPGIVHPFFINGYATVDLRAGFRWDDGRWRVVFWGKNVFDKYYFSNVSASGDAITRYTGLPATYGVTLGFKL